jgi:hypothetical protein
MFRLPIRTACVMLVSARGIIDSVIRCVDSCFWYFIGFRDRYDLCRCSVLGCRYCQVVLCAGVLSSDSS